MPHPADDLRDLIQDEFILTGSSPDRLTHWQEQVRNRGLSPLEAAFFVSDISRQVNEIRDPVDAIADQARALAAARPNGQLIANDLNLLIGAAKPLGLSAEFVRDRWLPTILATSKPQPSPAQPMPVPTPSVVAPNAPIVIDWLIPPGAPKPDLPTLAVHTPPAPTPPAPVATPSTPISSPTSLSAQPPSPTLPSLADPYASLVMQQPVQPVATARPFWETTSGIVVLAILLIGALVGGMLLLTKPKSATSNVTSSEPGRILSRQMGYRFVGQPARSLRIGVNATTQPMVSLTGPVSRAEQLANHQTSTLADKSYEWQAAFDNLPAGLYRVVATLPATQSGRAITVSGYVSLTNTDDVVEALVSKTRPLPTEPLAEKPTSTAVQKERSDPVLTEKPPIAPTTGLPDNIQSERGQYGERAAQRNGKWGLWRNGAWMIEPMYDDISLFRNRRAVVHRAGQTYDIDYFGNRIRDDQ